MSFMHLLMLRNGTFPNGNVACFANRCLKARSKCQRHNCTLAFSHIQVCAKKQAKFLKQFRRVKEDTKADKIHQDLVNDLHHVQRINKKFKDIILTDFSEQDKTFEKIILSLLRQVNTLTESSLQILDRTVPLEISEHIAKKNLYINRERNYL
ncbi:unnamed protein product [Aphanomyces euteiches]|nr:hypothetical protein AeRB84_015151 [Aphanomyces euteiches]